nr:hypothetical protein [uncultured Caldimonas sp.]
MAAMTDEQPFLADQIENYDAIVVKIIASPQPQTLRAEVLKIFSWGKGVEESCVGSEIEFVQAPGGWGDDRLEVGEKAVLFLFDISGKLYEDAWRGHLVIEEIEGQDFAIFEHRELWRDETISNIIREHSRQDPKRPYATAIQFDALEKYLLCMLEKMGRLRK